MMAFHTDFFDDRLLAGTISLASYGHEVMSDDDELIVQMEKVAQISTTVGTPGQTPVDFFPFRMWLLSFAKHDELLIVFLSSFFPDLAPRCRISEEVGSRKGPYSLCVRNPGGVGKERDCTCCYLSFIQQTGSSISLI